MRSKRSANRLVVVALVAFVYLGGCAVQTASNDFTLSQLIQDLNLVDGKVTLISLSKTDIGQPKSEPREEAIVLTQRDSTYTLRYVFRFPQSNNRWEIWSNNELIEDGTGAESLAMQEYSAKPTAEMIAVFRSKVRKA